MKISVKKIIMMCLSLIMVPLMVSASTISLNKSSLTLGVGYSEILKATTANGTNNSNIVWTSSNEKVATVINGKITGITEGIAVITASINGNKATCKVNISSDYIPVNGITLNKSSLNLAIDSTENLIKNITPSNATNQDVTWTSSNPDVATVVNGQVTGKKIGTTIITVSASGYKSTCKVTVVNIINLKGISINKKEITIKEKSTENLSIIYNPTNATNKKITWRSSNNNVVTVDVNGKVTGIKAGSATITAVSNDGGFVATTKVTVEAISKKVTSVTLDKKELTILSGETATLKATINPDYAENKEVTWESSDNNIATIENGKITAISPGETEIKVITKDGEKEAICKVTVKSPPIKSIMFKEVEQTVYVGSKTKLITIADPVNASIENPIWTSSNESVATISDGKVNALSLGTTIITISNEDKTITATMTLKVVKKPKEKLNIAIDGYDFKFDPEQKNYTLEIGSEKELTINTNVSQDKVTINGNKNLKDGSIITITITDEDKVTYVINIKKGGNYTIIFIAIVSILLLLNLIRLLIKNKKKSKLK